MNFAQPQALFLLFALLPLAVMLVGWARWRMAARATLRAGRAPAATWLLYPVLLLAFAVAAFGAARPRWGQRDVQIEQRGVDAVIVLDVSRSMLAGDVEPTRLDRAQDEIAELLQRMTGDRVGLVVFAGTAFVRSPLTSDVQALSRLVAGAHEESSLVQPGSDVGAGVQLALNLLAQSDEPSGRALIVVSDGEDFGSGTPNVQQIRRMGVRVYAAGVGTAEGAPVVDVDPVTGERVARTAPDGSAVLTRLDEQPLREFASSSGGRYMRLGGDSRPLAGIASELDSLPRTTSRVDDSSQEIERFPIFAATALALLLAATAAPALQAANARRARLLPLAAGALLFGGICAGDATLANRRGNSEYANGNFGGATDAYRTAQALAPDRVEPIYNAGNSLQRAGEQVAAIDEARRVLSFQGLKRELIARAEYALGSHYAAASRLTEARDAFRRALLAEPGDLDSKHNLEIIEQRLQPTPTPTATPTRIAGEDPPRTQVAATATAEGDGQGTPQAATAVASAQADDAATPAATPSRDRNEDATPEEVQRELEEALEGIDEDFTVEEALRVLELLEQWNRDQLARPSEGGNAPDY